MSYRITINTTKRESVQVCLLEGLTSLGCVTKSQGVKAEEVLLALEELLETRKLKLKDISSILVAQGPGSFTGVRVGVTIASTLASLLHIPINDGSFEQPVVPQYEKSKFD